MVQKKGNGDRVIWQHNTASTSSQPLSEIGKEDYVSSYYKIKVSVLKIPIGG
jgi:hypothetical protein